MESLAPVTLWSLSAQRCSLGRGQLTASHGRHDCRFRSRNRRTGDGRPVRRAGHGRPTARAERHRARARPRAPRHAGRALRLRTLGQHLVDRRRRQRQRDVRPPRRRAEAGRGPHAASQRRRRLHPRLHGPPGRGRYFELEYETTADSQATRAAEGPEAAEECLNYDADEARLVLVSRGERHELHIRAQAHKLVAYMAERSRRCARTTS